MILTALKLGKPVITANKALISAHGEELFAAAKAARANLYYEASVAGGIPIIKALRGGICGQPHHPHLRHRQRHLQLHPHPHEAGGARTLRRPCRRRNGWVTRRPIRRWTLTGWIPSTRSASWPRWRTAFGSSQSGFTSRASAPSRGRTSSLPANWVTPSSCWGWSRSRPAARAQSHPGFGLSGADSERARAGQRQSCF